MTEQDDNTVDANTKAYSQTENPSADIYPDKPAPWIKPGTHHYDSFGTDYRQHDSNMIDNDSLWSSPWLNLIMVLFAVLFLFVSLQINQNKTMAGLQAETSKPVETNSISAALEKDNPSEVAAANSLKLMPIILTEIKKYIKLVGSNNIQVTTLRDRSIKITLSASVLFERDRSQISIQARNFLDKLSTSLKKNRQQIHVIGHTGDQAVDTNQYPDNWALSFARASSVTRYLISSGQVSPYKFTIMGRAEYEPVAANLNDRARAMNNRVDIIVSRKITRRSETEL